MYCFKCGATVPDGSVFCSNCGASFGYAGSNQANPNTNTPNVQMNNGVGDNGGAFNSKTEPKPLYSKKEFFAKEASKNGKLFFKLIPYSAILCVIAVIISYITVFNTQVDEIPVVSFGLKLGFSIAGVSEDEIDDFWDDYEEEIEINVENMEYALERDFWKLNKDEEKLVEKYIDLLNKMEKKLTLNYAAQLIDIAAEADSQGIDSYMGLDLDEYSFVFDLASSVVCVILFLIMLIVYIFSILGGLLRNKILIIIGIISTVLFSIMWCNFVVLLLCVAIHAVMLAGVILTDKEFKNYRLSFNFFG